MKLIVLHGKILFSCHIAIPDPRLQGLLHMMETCADIIGLDTKSRFCKKKIDKNEWRQIHLTNNKNDNNIVDSWQRICIKYSVQLSNFDEFMGEL